MCASPPVGGGGCPAHDNSEKVGLTLDSGGSVRCQGDTGLGDNTKIAVRMTFTGKREKVSRTG
jgi:hypothetical protein